MDVVVELDLSVVVAVALNERVERCVAHAHTYTAIHSNLRHLAPAVGHVLPKTTTANICAPRGLGSVVE